MYFCGITSRGAIRSGENPPNPAKFLDSSLHPRKWAQDSVIGAQAVEFKFQTTVGFPWPRRRLIERTRRAICPDPGPPKLTAHDLRHRYASGGLLVGEGLPMIGNHQAMS